MRRKPINTIKSNNFDAIIIGAGSIGTPSAWALSKAGIKTLVIEKMASIGQGSNKTAIGGIRATHSQKAKAKLCKKSIEIYSTWKNAYGIDIEWKRGGYVYAIYEPEDADDFEKLVGIQKKWGLNINWYSNKEILNIVPFLNPMHLIGGTHSPEDGHASPLLAIYAFFIKAKENGASFHFDEEVVNLEWKNKNEILVKTDKDTYKTSYVVNAAGAWGSQIPGTERVKIPIVPELHEAGITEPVKNFIDPLVVDVRPFEGTSNFYFYQHATGQVLFCATPQPSIPGYETSVTSYFMPVAAKRLYSLVPRLKDIRIRRAWRGIYPMTPDGSPFLGPVEEYPGLILAVGMCGQGFMLGPGIGDLIQKLITNTISEEEQSILSDLSISRQSKRFEILS